MLVSAILICAPYTLYAQEEPEVERAASFFTGSHALLIGNSNYNAPWTKLPRVIDDINEVGRVLNEQGFTVHSEIDVRSDSFRIVIENFVQEFGSTPEHRILIYYAGHGGSPEEEGEKAGYIVPIDAPHYNDDPTGFAQSSISMDDFASYALDQVEARHGLYIFDSCFSGTVLGAIAGRQPTEPASLIPNRSDKGTPEPIYRAATNKVIQFIVSGTAEQTVPDYSVFRRRFVAALESKVNKFFYQNYITGDELGFYLSEQVAIDSDRIKKPQHPQSIIVNTAEERGNFLFDSSSILFLDDIGLTRGDTRVIGKQKINNEKWEIKNDTTLEIVFDLSGWRMRKFDVEVSFVDADSVENVVYKVDSHIRGNTGIRKRSWQEDILEFL